MNLCLDCNTAYSVPGTCNCYAPGGKRVPIRPIEVPNDGSTTGPMPPHPTIRPFIGGPMKTYGGASITWTNTCPFCGEAGCQKTHIVNNTGTLPSPTTFTVKIVDAVDMNQMVRDGLISHTSAARPFYAPASLT